MTRPKLARPAELNPSCCPLRKDPEARATANSTADALRAVFPAGVAAPALRALAGAGILELQQLSQIRKADLLSLHGIGPKAVRLLSEALLARGMDFLP